jgi:hypothetical protein
MSFPYVPNLHDVKMENLQTQLDHLNLLRLRHLQWMTSANDAQTRDMHLNIVERLKELTDQYSGLLGTLRR